MHCLRNRVITFFCSAFLLVLALYSSARAGQTPARSVTGRTLHVWKESLVPRKPYPSKQTAAVKITDALKEARAGDTVLVHGDCKNAAGRCTYQESLVLRCGVTLRGDGTLPAIPIIDGGGGDRVIEGGGSSCSADQVTTVMRFEIQNGKTVQYGGGIFFKDRKATIVENCIHDNQASRGGAIGIQLTDNTLPLPVVQISGNLIENNRATARGGAVTIESKFGNRSKLRDWHGTFDGNTVRHNKVVSSSGARWGGGLDVYDSRVRARKNLFENNTVEGDDIESYGGHVAVMNHDENITVSAVEALTLKYVNDIEQQQFLSEDNIYRLGGASGARNVRGGGAIAAIWNASVRMVRDWVVENRANTGGAVYLNARSLLELDATHFDNNGAVGDGGAAYVVCGSRVDVNGDNVIENNKAAGQSEVGGDRLKKKGWPTEYPRGGGGFFVRNAQARIRGKNIIRKNSARGVPVGYGGGLLLWQVDKALLFEEWTPRPELEALICNCLTQILIEGDNLFEENLALTEGGGIAIILEQDKLGVTQTVGGTVLQIDRPFERSQILARTQFINNEVIVTPEIAGGGIYYHDSLLPGAPEPDNSKWAKGQALISEALFQGNKGAGLKIVDTGLHLISAGGRLQYLRPTLEIVDSLITKNTGGGLELWNSWPRIVGNQFIGNGQEQIYIQGTMHLPILTENNLDGASLSEVGVSVISVPADGTSPGGWINRFVNNNIVAHKGHAAEVTLGNNSLNMERNYWGAKSVVVDAEGNNPANSVSNFILTEPPLTAAVNVPLSAFRPITIKPIHPTAPPIPRCEGLQRERPPGVPEDPPRRPADVPTVPTQPQNLPEATPSPLQPSPTPDRPQSVPDRAPTPQPSPSPQPLPSPSPNQPETPNAPTPNEWSFSVPADQVAPSTISAENSCFRRHRFEITLQNLSFIRLKGPANFDVAAGRSRVIEVEIDSRGLAPGEYTGIVIVRCVTCSGEVGCTQDRTIIPVRMIVRSRG